MVGDLPRLAFENLWLGKQFKVESRKLKVTATKAPRPNDVLGGGQGLSTWNF
jgi:hypothetical protein